MTESTKSFLNPQVTITEKERQQLFHSLLTFIHTIGISSPFNMALPYKLFYAVGSNDKKAIEEYTKLFLETYSPEFLEHYLYSYTLLLLIDISFYYIEPINVLMIFFLQNMRLLIVL